jgi:DNA-binding CsgD family transcriptional regulator
VDRTHLQQPGSGSPAAEPPADVLDVVNNCPLPSLLLAVPSERILAASPVAVRLLAVDDAELVGRSLEDFTIDEPTGALDLLREGRLDGYEARRVATRDGQPMPMAVWIRAVDTAVERRFVLALLLPEPGVLGEALQRPAGVTSEAVVGSTDAHVIVDRISADVEPLLGRRPLEVIGQSLLRLVHPADVAGLLRALAHSADTGLGTSLAVNVVSSGGQPRRCQLVVLPMLPDLSFAFAFLDEDFSADALLSAMGMRQALWQLDTSLRSASASRLAGSRNVPGLSQLSGRELDIVMRLMNGDRAPAIARSLFLSPSTVRNHLTRIFRKLDVQSQQELIHLLRGSDDPPNAT